MSEHDWGGDPDSWNVAKGRARMDRLFKLSKLQKAAYRRREQWCSIWLVNGRIEAALWAAHAAQEDRQRYTATNKAISEAYAHVKAER